MRVGTGVLNEILSEAVAMKQPPSDKGRRLRLYYITQVSVKPPTFVIFINDKELTHFSYTRYIENQAIKVIICLVLGYIFGCFQTGYFYGKLFKGIDVRNYGSGNAGTTNTLRTLGKPAGYIVFLGDALKAVFAVWIVRYLLFPGLGDVTKILETVTALGVVIGHN